LYTNNLTLSVIKVIDTSEGIQLDFVFSMGLIDNIHDIGMFNNLNKLSVVSWRGARPDVRMHPLRCRLVLHPPPPVGMGGGESAAPEFTS
jgi:hypothetical protein